MNLRNFIRLGLCLAAVAAVATSPAASADGQSSKQLMTQGELAKRVAFISGVADGIRAPVTGEDAAAALSGKGWTPIEGWRVGAVATKEDFFVVMAKYLGLKVENPNDPKSYLEALTLAGFAFGDAKTTPKSLEDRDKTISKLVLEVKGEAQFRQGAEGAWTKLGKLQVVQEGMSFRTGKDSHVDVVYTKGAAQRIEEDSEVTVEMLRDETVGGQPVRAVVIYIAKGEAESLVEPMNKASQFVMRDSFGKFEVDRAAGCTFTSRVAEDQSITLNRQEIRMARGLRTAVEIRSRSTYTVITGGAQYFRSGSSTGQVLHHGETATITLQTMGANGQTVTVDIQATTAAGLAALVERLQSVSRVLLNAPASSDTALMTTAELTSLLGGINGVGVVNKRITPAS